MREVHRTDAPASLQGKEEVVMRHGRNIRIFFGRSGWSATYLDHYLIIHGQRSEVLKGVNHLGEASFRTLEKLIKKSQ